MSKSGIRFLVDSVIGLVVAVVVWWIEGLFQAETALDVLRILSDGFFVAGMLFLAMGGLKWTTNGGVMDGLGFTFKTGLARIRSDYETAHMSFREYREARQEKATSPKSSLLAGTLHIAIAAVLYLVYTLL